VERNFEESDRAMVVTTSGRLKGAQEFTNSRQRLLAALERFERRGSRLAAELARRPRPIRLNVKPPTIEPRSVL
jgi:hypothetical protein